MACAQGHRLTGLRTEGYQSLRCPTCGTGVFVLPRSVLPEPPEATTPARKTAAVRVAAAPVRDEGPVELTDPIPIPEGDEEDAAVGEIEWVDEAAAPPEQPVLRGSPEDMAQQEIDARSPRGEPGVKSRPRAKARARTEEPADVAVPPSPRLSLREFLRRNRNVLIAVGVVLVVAATVMIRSWRSWRQDLPMIAELGRAEGLPALDEGKFVRAYQLLSEAKRAVIALGDAYQGAEAIKQGADEAEVINQLMPEGAETLLDEASRSDPKDWDSKFETLYKGRTLIVDASVIAIPDERGEGQYELDYVVLPPGGDGGAPRTVGRIDTKGFRLFDLIKPRERQSITFGARVASFRFDLEREEWRIGLEPDSGVIMTHTRALEKLPGWPSAADLSTGEANP